MATFTKTTWSFTKLPPGQSLYMGAAREELAILISRPSHRDPDDPQDHPGNQLVDAN
ncbi:MAG: hypothetical protein IPL59_00935 [Candidatus Competibacteraceae bacterium]|nr:hypothetical protein [Candidatus Competibacteraceae bacterium]